MVEIRDADLEGVRHRRPVEVVQHVVDEVELPVEEERAAEPSGAGAADSVCERLVEHRRRDSGEIADGRIAAGTGRPLRARDDGCRDRIVRAGNGGRKAKPRRAAPGHGGSGPSERSRDRRPAVDRGGPPIAVVTREELVGALPGERNLDVLRRQARQRHEADRREVGDRLVHCPGERLEVDRVVERQLQLVVVGSEVLRCRTCGRQLVVRHAGKSDGERLDRTIHATRHQRRDQAGVDASAEHHAEWDVAHQL